MDARPSDAINLALRFGAPVYVNKEVHALGFARIVHNSVYARTCSLLTLSLFQQSELQCIYHTDQAPHKKDCCC